MKHTTIIDVIDRAWADLHTTNTCRDPDITLELLKVKGVLLGLRDTIDAVIASDPESKVFASLWEARERIGGGA